MAACDTGFGASRLEATVADLAAAHAPALARHFYDVLLKDPQAAPFLSPEVVQQRLTRSLEDWIRTLFRVPRDEGREALADLQRKIGERHARIKMSLALVMKGAVLLKERFAEILMASELDPRDVARAIVDVDARMDWAIGLMSEAYMEGSLRRAQVDEAFRLFAVGQDVSLERERQIAALLDWLQGTLFILFEGREVPLTALSRAPFGLWFTHQAGLIFQGMSGLEAIQRTIQQVDREILPSLDEARQTPGRSLAAELARLKAAVQEIKFLTGELFQAVAGIESGRDPLTRALNRRFLPTILGREVSIAKAGGVPLTLLLLDIDHFKAVNDTWGHAAGDFVLGQVAELVSDNVRLNDFVFRYGGEEFLVVLVETGLEDARAIADRIRQQLAGRELRLPAEGLVRITLSAGVAGYRGHPDFNVMIEAADRALYAAKRAGRNCTVVATD